MKVAMQCILETGEGLVTISEHVQGLEDAMKVAMQSTLEVGEGLVAISEDVRSLEQRVVDQEVNSFAMQ